MVDKITNCKFCGEYRTTRAGTCHKCYYKHNREHLLHQAHMAKGGYRFKIDISKCELCGISAEKATKPQGILVHHKDCNFKNNAVENLQALCNSCHGRLHSKLDRWDKTNAHNPLKKLVNGKWVGNIIMGTCKFCKGEASTSRLACLTCYDFIRHEAQETKVWVGKMKLLSEKEQWRLYNERKSR